MSFCPLCVDAGGIRVWRSSDWHVVRVEDADFPAFYRVIANQHVAEFSQLRPSDRATCMELVATVERTLLKELAPTKVNLAQFGNVVPHLHWHVIARFDWDTHFPQPIWGSRERARDGAAIERINSKVDSVDRAVCSALDSLRYARKQQSDEAEV